MSVDWGVGQYERTAEQLEPVARRVVELAGVHEGDRVLDLACGTGNAALVAARAGAAATGLDAAARLVDVARERAAAEGLSASFVVGDVQELPFDDEAFDVVVSIFGVIFAQDPDRAVSELLRVLRPGGRALLSVWVPAGALDAMLGVFSRAMREATGESRERFGWHDLDAVRPIVTRHGATVEALDAELAFTADSPEAYFAESEEHHPMSLAMGPLLQQAGTYESTRDEALAVLREGNEDPERFQITSPYRVLELRPA
jgi:SAM-dependent methyltransferase